MTETRRNAVWRNCGSPVGRRGVAAAMALAVGALLLAGAEGLAAQAQAGATGTLRPYWHVFAAYALAWLILFGWVVSIGRRLRRVEDREPGGPGSVEDAGA